MGYRLRLKNLIRIQGIPKLVELAIISILAMVTRFGGPDGKDLVLGDDPENSDAFGHMIVYGYFLIIIVQIIGVVLEEDYNFQVVSHKKEANRERERAVLALTLLWRHFL